MKRFRILNIVTVILSLLFTCFPASVQARPMTQSNVQGSVLYECGRSLCLMPISAKEPIIVVESNPQQQIFGYAISADNTAIVYALGSVDYGVADVYIAGIDGGNQQRLFQIQGKIGPLGSFEGFGVIGISSDNQRIIFENENQVYTAKLDGSDRRQVTPEIPYGVSSSHSFRLSSQRTYLLIKPSEPFPYVSIVDVASGDNRSLQIDPYLAPAYFGNADSEIIVYRTAAPYNPDASRGENIQRGEEITGYEMLDIQTGATQALPIESNRHILTDASGGYVITGKWSSAGFTDLGVTNLTSGEVLPIVLPGYTYGNLAFSISPVQTLTLIDQYLAETNQRFNETLDIATQVAADGDYFERELQKQGDTASVVFKLVINTLDIVTSASRSASVVKEAIKHNLPSPVGPAFQYLDQLQKVSPELGNLYGNSFAAWSSERVSRELAARAIGSGIQFVAGVSNQTLEQATVDAALQQGFEARIQGDQALQRNVIPGYSLILNKYRASIRDLALEARQSLSQRPADAINAYYEDLRLRLLADKVAVYILKNEVQPLHNAAIARQTEQENWLRPFAAKILCFYIAKMAFKSPIALAGAIGVPLIYQEIQNRWTIDENAQLYGYAIQSLSGVSSTQKNIYINAIEAMKNISAGIPPQVAAGSIVSFEPQFDVVSVPVGFRLPKMRPEIFIRKSALRLRVQNTTAYPTRYIAYAVYHSSNYAGTTQQLIADGMTDNMVAGQSEGEVTLRFLQDNYGETPDHGDTIRIYILGETETGVYYITYSEYLWSYKTIQAETNEHDGFVAYHTTHHQQSSDVVIAPYPVRAWVNTQYGPASYTPIIYIENPFDQQIDIAVRQPIPSGVRVIDTGSGKVNGNAIVWSQSLAPRMSMLLTHTIDLSTTTAGEFTYPAAEVTMTDQQQTGSAIFSVNPATFTLKPALDGSVRLSSTTIESPSISFTVNIANAGNHTATGRIYAMILDDRGTQVAQITHDLQLASQDSQQVDIQVPVPADVGIYQLEVLLETDGVTKPIFSTLVERTTSADPTATVLPAPIVQPSLVPTVTDNISESPITSTDSQQSRNSPTTIILVVIAVALGLATLFVGLRRRR